MPAKEVLSCGKRLVTGNCPLRVLILKTELFFRYRDVKSLAHLRLGGVVGYHMRLTMIIRTRKVGDSNSPSDSIFSVFCYDLFWDPIARPLTVQPRLLALACAFCCQDMPKRFVP